VGNRLVGNHSVGLVTVDSWAVTSNNVFAQNQGGAIADVRGELVCTNDTICDQTGAGISVEEGTVFLTNSIVAGNGGTGLDFLDGNVVLFDCLVEGGVFQHRTGGGELPINGEIPNVMRGRENFDAKPGFTEDSWRGEAASAFYDEKRLTTLLVLNGNSELPGRSPGGPIRIGGNWGVIAGIGESEIRVWGNLTSDQPGSQSDLTLYIPPSYRLAADSECVDAGMNLGAPSFDIEGDRRPVHRVADGTVDVGADEFTPE